MLESGYRGGIRWTALHMYMQHMGVTKQVGDVIIKLVRGIDSVYVACANEEVSHRIKEQNKQ